MVSAERGDDPGVGFDGGLSAIHCVRSRQIGSRIIRAGAPPAETAEAAGHRWQRHAGTAEPSALIPLSNSGTCRA